MLAVGSALLSYLHVLQLLLLLQCCCQQLWLLFCCNAQYACYCSLKRPLQFRQSGSRLLMLLSICLRMHQHNSSRAARRAVT